LLYRLKFLSLPLDLLAVDAHRLWGDDSQPDSFSPHLRNAYPHPIANDNRLSDTSA
jgi:hypothetical protein